MVQGGYMILKPNHNFMQSKEVPIQAMSNHIDIFIKKTSFAGLHHLYLCPKKQSIMNPSKFFEKYERNFENP